MINLATIKPTFDLEKPEHSKFVSQFSNKRAFIKQFKNKFNSVRAYHATNLSKKEIVSIKKNGLKIPSREFFKQKSVLRLSEQKDSKALLSSIKSGVDKYFDSEDFFLEEKIFFGLVRAPFIDDWYHYLLLGSEHLIPLADKLRNELFINFRQRMRDSGKHCIIEATIPLKLVRNIWIEGIFSYVNEGCDEANLILKNPLKPEYIKVNFIKRPFDPKGFARI